MTEKICWITRWLSHSSTAQELDRAVNEITEFVKAHASNPDQATVTVHDDAVGLRVAGEYWAEEVTWDTPNTTPSSTHP